MTVLNFNGKTFIIHITALEIELIVLINLLNKIIISIKYLGYIIVFFLKFITKFLEHKNEDHIIKL